MKWGYRYLIIKFGLIKIFDISVFSVEAYDIYLNKYQQAT